MKNELEKTGIKILVVEDSRTQAEHLRHILERSGYRVCIATNGKDALEMVRNEKPAIILTDIIMPEMDGYELCKALRKDKNTAELPVILVTQLFDPADLVKGLEAGADNIIIKPFEPGHVISRITSTLAGEMNQKVEAAGGENESVEMSIGGTTHHIPAAQLRKPTIMLSTYDLAVRKAAEQQEELDRLAQENRDLANETAMLKQANENLIGSESELRGEKEDIARENKRLQIMATLTRDTLITQLTALQECLEQVNQLRDKDHSAAWDHITKAELVVVQIIKTLR